MAAPRREIGEGGVEPAAFGRYLLLDPIAEGRMGTVHRACLRRAGRPDKLLAIKHVSPELSGDPDFAGHFNRVLSRAAELEHPEHCAIEDLGRAPDGSLFAALELVSGKDLARVAAAAQERVEVMPAPLVAYVGSRIARVLAAAHAIRRSGQAAPLYHGELAPADILIGYDGGVRLTGLGSSVLQVVSPDPAPRHAYRAPELGPGECSAPGDVFSLGACLHEMLTGRPAAGDDVHRSLAAAGRGPESYITRVVPRPLEQIVARALAEIPRRAGRARRRLPRRWKTGARRRLRPATRPRWPRSWALCSRPRALGRPRAFGPTWRRRPSRARARRTRPKRRRFPRRAPSTRSSSARVRARDRVRPREPESSDRSDASPG